MAPVPKVPVHFCRNEVNNSPTAPPQENELADATNAKAVLNTIRPISTYRALRQRLNIFLPKIKLTPSTKKNVQNK